MTEILGESVLRDRNVTTLPPIIRDMWNISIGERIRWELNSSGDICVCRVISKKVNGNGGGKNERSSSPSQR